MVFADNVTLFPKPGVGQVLRMITHRQKGRVKFKETSWPARFYQRNYPLSAAPSDEVLVIGRSGITLIVIPLGDIIA